MTLDWGKRNMKDDFQTQWAQLDIDSVRLDPIRLRQRQRRSLDEIAKSIHNFGFIQPIVVDEDHIVIIGHGRLQAARRLGYKVIPAVVVTGLTDEQRWRLRIADNRLAELSGWNEAALAERMEQLHDGGQDVIPGFSGEEIEDILGLPELRKANAELPPQREDTPEHSELHLLVSCRASAFDRMMKLIAALEGESWCTLEQGAR
jgi:ParB/RepB/Spo0J family partition protein